jgi:SAM-dependent methyltransferase
MGGEVERDWDWRHRVRFSDCFRHEESQKVLCRAVTRHWGPGTKSLRVLDAACGDGSRVARLLDGLDLVVEVDWVDRSPAAIDLARLSAARLSPERANHWFAVRTYQEHLAVTEGTYDMITVLNALNVPRDELGDLIYLLLNRLTPAGLLLIEMPTSLAPLHRIQLSAERLQSGRIGLPVGRSVDVTERLLALGADFAESQCREFLDLGRLSGRCYSDLTRRERRVVLWLTGGRRPTDKLGQAILDLVLPFAETDESGCTVLRSSVNVWEVKASQLS